MWVELGSEIRSHFFEGRIRVGALMKSAASHFDRFPQTRNLCYWELYSEDAQNNRIVLTFVQYNRELISMPEPHCCERHSFAKFEFSGVNVLNMQRIEDLINACGYQNGDLFVYSPIGSNSVILHINYI